MKDQEARLQIQLLRRDVADLARILKEFEEATVTACKALSEAVHKTAILSIKGSPEEKIQ